MRLWMRYLRERRLHIVVYLAMVSVILAVGSLYHVEDLEKMLYAALLALAIGSGIGVMQGMKYVAKCRKLEGAARYYAQSGELPLEELYGTDLASRESIEDCRTLEESYGYLAHLVEAGERRAREEWEKQTIDHNDYYMMWTHQIKVPISAMKLLLEGGGGQELEAVPGDGTGTGTSQNRTFLMREELFKIDQYVEMVLGFQRLESLAEDLVLASYELEGLCRQVVKKFSVLFINKGLSLDLREIRGRIVTDEKLFTFCLEQILSNSIKYTRQGSICIHGEEREDAVLLHVEDTGIGIRKEDLPRIFERGFTGYNGRLDKKSTGIGLYLCRRVFGHLGIHMQVESQVGEGTKVTLVCLTSATEDTF